MKKNKEISHISLKDDNSLKQLYENSSNGKSIFVGRRNNDFFTGIYNNSGNTSLDPQHSGGELDVFDETLTTEFFEGHSISGYRIEKTGTDRLYLGVFGLAKALSSNNLNDLK